MHIVKIEKVSKDFKDKKVLDNITLDIKEGSMCGFLGPNGAGKTTLIRCITQIIVADSGTIYFNGEKLSSKHIHEIGYMPEERGLYKKMNVYSQLLYLSRLKGFSSKESKNKIDFWLEKFDISNWRDKKIEELSKGMGQKIQFIATVISDPKLLILDEPFSGLDPINAELIRNEIIDLNKKGTTIIFSTHRMEQVEQLCEEIVLINQGEKILSGNLKEIINNSKENKFKIEFADYSSKIKLENAPCTIIEANNNEVVFKINEDQSSNEVLRFFMDKGNSIASLTEILPSIKDIFIKMVNTESDFYE